MMVLGASTVLVQCASNKVVWTSMVKEGHGGR